MQLTFTRLFAGFFIFEWVIRIVMLFIVPSRRKPSSANAWLLLIMVIPTIGTILFYMFGDPKLPKTRRRLRRKVDSFTRDELDKLRGSYPNLFAKLVKSDYQTLSRLATVLGGLPPMNGNKIEIITGYEAAFETLIKDIDAAQEYIHIEYFIATYDDTTKPVFLALERASVRGVHIRFLYDKVVSRRYPGQKKMKQELNRIGVELIAMLPLFLVPGKKFMRPDLRNHRKIVVIDGKVAHSGSQNLIDRSYHRRDGIIYEEVVLRFKGPIVWQFNNIFRSDWYAETHDALLELVEDEDVPDMVGDITAQVLPSGPAHEHDNNLKFYTSMIHSAKKRIGIVVPYFIPDESFFDALTAAAQRGVKVTMINSASIDKILAGHAQRSYYEELLEVGVEIYLYNEPVFLHTKQILIDDDVAIVGSSNLDIRSFQLDLEVSTILYDTHIVKKLEHIESEYLKTSKKVTMKVWQSRSLRLKMLDRIARLTAAFQ
ncbi:MAG TPA: cardiolipin synthase [Candidatus Saccharibacteria bacterium]|nr:cardiolipin synthase [Candidatus Saccharibacteria bacterium]